MAGGPQNDGPWQRYSKIAIFVIYVRFLGVFTILLTKILQVIPFFACIHDLEIFFIPTTSFEHLARHFVTHLLTVSFKGCEDLRRKLGFQEAIWKKIRRPLEGGGGAELPCSFWYVYLLEMMKRRGSRKLGKLVGRPVVTKSRSDGFFGVWQIPEMSGATFFGQIAIRYLWPSPPSQ